MGRGKITKEKRMCISQKGLKKKEICSDQELLRFIRDPTIELF